MFLQRISPFRLSTPKKMVTTQLDDHDEKEEHVKFTDAKPRKLDTDTAVSLIVACYALV